MSVKHFCSLRASRRRGKSPQLPQAVLDDVSIWAEGAQHDVGDKNGDVLGVRAAGKVGGYVFLCELHSSACSGQGLHSGECFVGVCVFG